MQQILTVDAHAAGEPCRVVHSGLPVLAGSTMKERRRFLRERLDWVRTALTHEPRGHSGMFGAVLTPPVTPGAAYGLIFFDPVGYMDGCGHGTLCSIAAWWRLFGALPTPFTIDNPDDSRTRVLAVAGDDVHCEVELELPPATVLADRIVLPDVNGNACAIAQCGNTFMIVDVAAAGLPDLRRSATSALQSLALRLRHAVRAKLGRGVHDNLEVLMFQEIAGPQRTFATFVLFNGSQVDRSPCGTGSAALSALLTVRGEMATGEVIRTIGPAGAHFEVESHGRRRGSESVEVRLRGTAYITGIHEWIFPSSDSFARGYVLA